MRINGVTYHHPLANITNGAGAAGGGGGGGAWSDTKSYDFDGTDEYVSIHPAVATGMFDFANTGTGYSVSVWFKGGLTDGTYERLWSICRAFGTSSSEWQAITIRTVSGVGTVWAQGFGGGGGLWKTPASPSGGSGYVAVNSGQTNGIQPSDGNWHHICVTVDTTQNQDEGIKLYLDGNYAGYAHISNRIEDFGEGAFACLFYRGGTRIVNHFSGLIAQGSHYNSAISAEQVTAIYAGGNSMDERTLTPAPVNFYRFGDGDSDFPTVVDYGTADKDGTAVNMEVGDIVEDSPP